MPPRAWHLGLYWSTLLVVIKVLFMMDRHTMYFELSCNIVGYCGSYLMGQRQPSETLFKSTFKSDGNV